MRTAKKVEVERWHSPDALVAQGKVQKNATSSTWAAAPPPYCLHSAFDPVYSRWAEAAPTSELG